jgi:hypothetical protein
MLLGSLAWAGACQRQRTTLDPSRGEVQLALRLVALIPPQHQLVGLADALDPPFSDFDPEFTALAEALCSSGEAWLELLALSNSRLLGRLRRAVADDYLRQRLVNLSGWLVSRTEAGVCRLAAALADGE